MFAVREETSAENTPAWAVRVVPNKYPALTPDADGDAADRRCRGDRSGFGYHEVLIDTPVHGVGLAALPLEHLTRVLGVYRTRLRVLSADIRIRSLLLFRNEGREAGASQAHSHSQLLAMAHVPPSMKVEIRKAQRYFRVHGRCVTCDLLDQQADGGPCFVARRGNFAALTSNAPRFPYETWIAPVAHAHDFRTLADEELGDLAALVQETLRGIEATIGSFPFNVVLHTSPVRTGRNMRMALHWRLEIVPRVSIQSGLEIGSHVYIVSVPPEHAAARLRAAMATLNRPVD